MRPLSFHRLASSLVVLVTLVLPACASDGGSGEDLRTVELTAEDAGSAISVRPGDEIVVTLGSNATTGFAWELTVEPAAEILEFLGSEYVAPETELVGAGGQEVWRFRAAAEGTTSFTLTYLRSFSGETAGEPFDLTVLVQRAG
ncbi:MAG TPA: protease inhibitor I42 family protein [Actinomycetota bacterium]|nr:protease inhibitor I42 family protein [Actinomycetota bacterium]